MKMKNFLLLILICSAIALSGCASTAKSKDMQMQGLRNQINLLETQLQNKDEEIENLRYELEKAKDLNKSNAVREVKSRPNTKQIQIALSNAGFYPGKIDGKMGKKTKEAIKTFQKANNLKVDGRVGKKTWALLGEYLERKVK